ncbi:DUF1996 domain-containing protein [Streptomyces regalis]|uniref:DUF1996 domain-containing protein n=1 Tax=Streptomyces regalis TaxID=68262 RepID=A0A117MLX1_9ACTN|nr:DUF1996 domain-containing protein [Streptomyces regalis]KUL24622.1 hypothetical protein ADL12_36545 [Streptomyces regalis]
MLGGGGLVAANVYASATEDGAADPARTLSSPAGTIDCPDVGSRLTAVPDGAKEDVAKELALLDQQIAEAYQRLQESAQAIQQDAGFADSAIMNPLKEKRTATIERIAIAVDREGERPGGLESLAPCTLRAADSGNGDQANDGQDEGGDNEAGQEGADQGNEQPGAGEQPGNGGQAGNGPVAADFADITAVQPNVPSPAVQQGASRGTFATSCGVNENGLFNSDNVIVAPGVSNGAHHFHDYIGNQANDAFASDEDLANAETTCVDQGDKSTYYWPVLRLQNGTQEQDANSPGGGIEGNAGKIVTPKEVTLTFVGNPRSKVTEMPRLLRIITGDAKAFVNGTANANASWSCTGFEDRQLKDKYPLCPQGSDVVRSFKFQSCWDGQNIDSANHRTHVAFATADGGCPEGFKAIPQLVQRIVYDVDAPSLQDGGRTTPLFAVDSFPEQLHKPVTDHGDFINVFAEDLMGQMVDCINEGRKCGAGADQGGDPGEEEPTQEPQPSQSPDTPPGGNEDPEPGNGEDEPTDAPTTEAPATDEPATEAPGTEPAKDDKPTVSSTVAPKSYGTPSATEDATAPAQGGSADDAADAGSTPAQTQPAAVGEESGGGTEPQAVGGGLAETGTTLWPAAAGAVLLMAGFLLLMRTRRRAG